MLAAHYRSEFLATPQLVRVDYAESCNGFEPTLLVKGSTLLLKYILLGARLQFHLARIEDRILYAFTAFDDESKPAMLWSVMESEAEANALSGLSLSRSCPVFLFNEVAINVSWSTLRIIFPQEIQSWISTATLGACDYAALAGSADNLLDRAYRGAASNGELLTTNIDRTEPWHPISSNLITSHGTNSPIDIFSTDEGGQQEQLAIWLTDNLHPRSVHHSPQISKGAGQRELTDILMSHEYGAFLIESKALTIFNRESLPSRTRLVKDISRHIEKAVRQLRGGIRRLKEGVPVTSHSGAPVEVERTEPMHAIILIPEFDLIEQKERFGPAFITEFMEATGGFIHMLDVAELLRVVQAAEILSQGALKVTPMMALDYYLMERVKRSADAGTLCIEVLLRVES